MIAAPLAFLFALALYGAWMTAKFRIVISPDGICVEHPHEKVFVPWSSYSGLRAAGYGSMEIAIKHAEDVSFVNSRFARKFKEATGQPPLVLPVGNLQGGEEVFAAAIREGEQRWAHR